MQLFAKAKSVFIITEKVNRSYEVYIQSNKELFDVSHAVGAI